MNIGEKQMTSDEAVECLRKRVSDSLLHALQNPESKEQQIQRWADTTSEWLNNFDGSAIGISVSDVVVDKEEGIISYTLHLPQHLAEIYYPEFLNKGI